MLSGKQEVWLADVVDGFRGLVWQIVGYDSTDEILKQVIPLVSADEARISSILTELASKHLNAAEIAAGFAKVRKDDLHANRITLSAGENPYYVASLWRSDELAKET